MYFINPVITDLAQTRVNEAINANQPLIFTKLSIGKGKQVGDLKKVSSLKTHFMDLSIAKELQGETIKLFSRLSNEGFVDEAHITELGIFAKVGNAGPEFLFMYTCADQGDIVPPANRGAYIRTYRFETTLSSDGELTINVVAGEGVFLTSVNLEQHTDNKSNPHNVTKEQVIGLVNATASVDGLMSNGDKFKLDTVELGANNYTHPTTHPASMITETSTKRFVTDTEKSTWNAKANTSVASTSSNGLMSSVDKTKLDGVANGANNYVHPSTHPYSMITGTPTSLPANGGNANTVNNKTVEANVPANAKFTDTNTTYGVVTTSSNGLMASGDKSKLDGIASGANNYTHPATHQASMITESAIRRFVSDAEKMAWNDKASTSIATTSAKGLMSSSDKTKLNGIATGAEVNRTIAIQAQAEDGTVNSTVMTPLRTKQAITKQAMVVVNHGTTASTARPTGAVAVYWIGSVEPTNATDNDLWIGG